MKSILASKSTFKFGDFRFLSLIIRDDEEEIEIQVVEEEKCCHTFIYMNHYVNRMK